MFYKQTPVKITGNGLAAGCQVFYRKIYGFFFYSVPVVSAVQTTTVDLSYVKNQASDEQVKNNIQNMALKEKCLVMTSYFFLFLHTEENISYYEYNGTST